MIDNAILDDLEGMVSLKQLWKSQEKTRENEALLQIELLEEIIPQKILHLAFLHKYV